MHPSLGSTPADLHFHVCSLLPIRVFWIFCVEFFKGLLRSLGTKSGLWPLPPTLDVQSASVRGKSKFPEETTVQLTNPASSSGYSWCTSMHAACQTWTCSLYTSNLLKLVPPEKQKQHILRKLLRMGYSSVHSTPHRNPSYQRDPPHWTDQALDHIN